MPIVSTSKGYDTNATQVQSVSPNGWLTYRGREVPLWVQEVTTGFGMSGSIAQSSRTRTFFAHNFEQVAITVNSQFPSQQHMADVAQLVRRSHIGLESAMFLEILGKKGPTHRNLKGASQNIVAEGYITSIPREHMQFIYAPDMSFSFVVERMISPAAWADSPVKIRKLKSWHDIVEGVMAHDPNAGFLDDPDGQTNTNTAPDPLPPAIVNRRVGTP